MSNVTWTWRTLHEWEIKFCPIKPLRLWGSFVTIVWSSLSLLIWGYIWWWKFINCSVQFSRDRLFATLRAEACQTSWSITNSQSLLKLMSIESVMPSNHLILYLPLLLPPSIFPASGSFPMSWFFTSGSKSIGISASVSVLPMKTQDWSPLGWTGWISSQSKGLSRVFSNTTVQKHQFFMLSFLYSPTLTSIHDHWKNHSLD